MKISGIFPKEIKSKSLFALHYISLISLRRNTFVVFFLMRLCLWSWINQQINSHPSINFLSELWAAQECTSSSKLPRCVIIRMPPAFAFEVSCLSYLNRHFFHSLGLSVMKGSLMTKLLIIQKLSLETHCNPVACVFYWPILLVSHLLCCLFHRSQSWITIMKGWKITTAGYKAVCCPNTLLENWEHVQLRHTFCSWMKLHPQMTDCIIIHHD